MASGKNTWDPEVMFDLYLHDYLLKRKMHQTAEIFRKEAKITDIVERRVAIDTPQAFLYEWWAIFYDVYSSRYLKHKEVKAKSSVKVEQITESEQQSIQPIVSAVTQNRPEQFRADSDFDKMSRGKPATSCPPAGMFEEKQQCFRQPVTNWNLNLLSREKSVTHPSSSAAASPRILEGMQHFRQPMRNFDPNSLSLGSILNPSTLAATGSSYQQQQSLHPAYRPILPRESRNANTTGRAIHVDATHYGVQNGIYPIARAPDARLNGGVNPAISSQNRRLTMPLIRAPICPPQQFLMLPEEYEENGEVLSAIPGNLTPDSPGPSTKSCGETPSKPERNMRKRDAEGNEKK